MREVSESSDDSIFADRVDQSQSCFKLYNLFRSIHSPCDQSDYIGGVVSTLDPAHNHQMVIDNIDQRIQR